jgi:hypothetical protein
VLVNDLHDQTGAEAAFLTAIASGHPQQTALAQQNLSTMRRLAAEGQHNYEPVDDGTDVSIGHGKGASSGSTGTGRTANLTEGAEQPGHTEGT